MPNNLSRFDSLMKKINKHKTSDRVAANQFITSLDHVPYCPVCHSNQSVVLCELGPEYHCVSCKTNFDPHIGGKAMSNLTKFEGILAIVIIALVVVVFTWSRG